MYCSYCKEEIGYMEFPLYRYGFILHEHCFEQIKQEYCYCCVIS